MDVKDFMRLSKELEKTRTSFDHLSLHEELWRAKVMEPLDSLTNSSSRLAEQLAISKGFTQSLVNDQVGRLARESSLLAAQCQGSHLLHDQIKQLTQGWSTTHELAQVAEDLRVKLGVSVFGFKSLQSRLEVETAGLLRSLNAAAENSFTSSLASLTAAVNTTSLLAAAGWVRDFETDRWSQNQAKMMEHLFQPSFAYGHFAARTLDLLGGSVNNVRASALAGSLLLANEQSIRATSLIQPLVDLRSFPDDQLPLGTALPRRPIINRYRIQRDELLESEEEVPDESDYETIVTFSASAPVFETARHCLELVGMCIETSQTCTGGSIFKLTPMVLISFSGLLGTVACNRMTLAHIVGNLYIILYESAGKDRLRYLDAGYVNEDECEVIWKIKHLRNKWLSHDAEHGKESDIRKSRQARMEALQWLGVHKMPTANEDYAVIHRALLNKVDQFLSLLLTRIAGQDSSGGGTT